MKSLETERPFCNNASVMERVENGCRTRIWLDGVESNGVGNAVVSVRLTDSFGRENVVRIVRRNFGGGRRLVV